MKISAAHFASALLMAAFITNGVSYAQAPDVMNPPIKTTVKKKKAKAAKFMSGSQETKKERVARLKRECKGSVNAGACTGYTR